MKAKRSSYMSNIRNAVPSELIAKIVDDFDQDHAMILSEGTNHGLFNSIMMKPPNMKAVYPMRRESKNREEIRVFDYHRTNAYREKQGPIIIFNPDTMNPQSPLYQYGNNVDIDFFMRTFYFLEEAYEFDYDVIILVHPTQKEMWEKMVEGVNFTDRGNKHI